MAGHRRNKPTITLTLKRENVARLDEEAARLRRSRSFLVDWILDIVLSPDKNLETTLEELTNHDNSVM